MYSSIFNSFPVIRTASAKNRHFHVPQPTFLFPLETPLRLSRSMLHGWKGNSMLAKPLAACTHLSSIVSELLQLQVPKIAVFKHRSPHFCFHWRRPCNYHATCCMDGKTIQCLAACTHLSSTVSQLFKLQVPKIAVFTYRSPHFCFPWRRPCDYHAIQCLSNPSQHVPIYIQ